MSIIPRKHHAKYKSIQLKTNELLTYIYSYHGNLVTIAARYVADAYRSQRSTMPNMKSIRLKTKELQG